MRREIPLLITSIAGLVFAISYFIPHWPFGESESIFGDWITIVQSFAIWLGALNLLKVSFEKIYRKRKDSLYAGVIIFCLVATLIIGFYDGFSGLMQEPEVSFRAPGTHFDWVFVYIYTPLSSTMFAMLAFFVASASYRAFRARNFEATLLLIAAFFVMGGRVPLFDLPLLKLGISDVPYFSLFADWIMSYPLTGGMTAIMIGIALGIMSSSLRIILGIERSHVGGA
ncbi:MAG: hypothetical protein DWP97_01825 [Calditrichaeota bacterium]|nr:MAG: hypothetical protein DWP97_01825 [Calditrichota bacterium]